MTAHLLAGQIRTAGQGRGFSESRLLTNWEEIVGPELAKVTMPAKVSYGKGGLGATLTILSGGVLYTLM